MDYFFNFLKLFQGLVAKNVKITHLGLDNVSSICAIDVAYKGNIGFAAAIRKADNQIEKRVISGNIDLPYVPGFLFIREAPIMIKALEGFQCDLILVDGHGLAHPRKSGIATVIGVLIDKPVIGVAKSKLIGEIVNEGNREYIIVNGEKVGIKSGKYFYSPGNLTDLDDCISLSSKGYPDILKLADKLSKEAKK
ncbi:MULTISPECIES: endonuclease V [Acidianus]|uniref:Endonuclease V n=1 Tax=Candidatus Acidianus copahuensis TaxID=1160895 RepID=A0A031LTR3_9CREN|nr:MULTISPECIES: endonuclease V [Acidianus]EZQ11120.1 endonuclease V [Candidatus Acidianus copahuensis]NON62503.1 endonuclease V [Acidianus sp. RZ1]